MTHLEGKNSNWEKLQVKIEETVEVIQNLRKEKKLLEEKNTHLNVEEKKFAKLKKDMERKIKELIEKLKNFEE